jgi:hypothetical protein
MSDQNNSGPIPTPPGGGSWTFDPERFEWVSNDPVHTEKSAEAAPASAPKQPEVIIGEE